MTVIVSILAALFVTVVSHQANAASAEEFYKGKTIRLVVGFAAGGGFDSYARILARHMPRHTPGNPALIVDNMAGAGSRLAANIFTKPALPMA
jgi:tripartite-type tricarboxylate transporter receptor subunit TctC